MRQFQNNALAMIESSEDDGGRGLLVRLVNELERVYDGALEAPLPNSLASLAERVERAGRASPDFASRARLSR